MRLSGFAFFRCRFRVDEQLRSFFVGDHKLSETAEKPKFSTEVFLVVEGNRVQ